MLSQEAVDIWPMSKNNKRLVWPDAFSTEGEPIVKYRKTPLFSLAVICTEVFYCKERSYVHMKIKNI